MTRQLALLVDVLFLSLTWLLLSLTQTVYAQSVVLPSVDESFYLQQVKPILQERCYSCHGALKQKGGLRLDTAHTLLKGGDSGVVVSIRQSEDSELVRRMASHSEDRMPPPHEGESIKPEELKKIKEWIDAGAPRPSIEEPASDPTSHWSFRPIVRPEVPKISDSQVVRNPIDAFLGLQREKADLLHQSTAPPLTLLRRLALDVTGLPPDLESVERLLGDKNASDFSWYDNEVDRLLENPAYGERWGRHWMDVWRYSDWWGLGDQLRNSQLHIWHWRDWIVESLNKDLSYDEMVRQMLAADELYPNDIDKLRATGFLARNYFLFNRNQWLEETVEHVGKGLLGLTMNCAKCHDHKYDPISQEEYYQMRAIFEPYHVRLDMIPGERDLKKNGIPRVYDGLLDTPTYRFVRGEESKPDKSKTLSAAVPEFLAFQPLEIVPLTLPAESHQPERRMWVIESYLTLAREKLEQVANRLKTHEETLTLAKQTLRSQSGGPRSDDAQQNVAPQWIVEENWTTIDSKLWKSFGGDWHHEPGKLAQRQDGPVQSTLRLQSDVPRDFEAIFRFTIHGGSQWRSVGIAFDSAKLDPTQTYAPEESEVTVYASAFEGEKKVQAAFKKNQAWNYPANAKANPPVPLGQSCELRILVKDKLVNVYFDGKFSFSWVIPIDRLSGALQLTTFDAIATFEAFQLRALLPETKLYAPNNESQLDPKTVEGANAIIAMKDWESKALNEEKTAVEEEIRFLERRLVEPEHGDERPIALARARFRLAQSEWKLKKALPDKLGEAEKEFEDAKKSLTSLESSTDSVATLFPGAVWSATRFQFSGNDDPNVAFPSTSSGRRTAFAKWVTDKRNPLTARVAVNHIWGRHFGEPLVSDIFDFGMKPKTPLHTDLLDWLAAEFIESGWSMKHIHRLILQSNTYRLSSSSATPLVAVEQSEIVSPNQDSDNRYWCRRPSLRLESQVVRDSILALAGTLDPTKGGPSIPASDQPTSKRRSLYFYHSNNDRNLFLSMFDEALVNECYRRDQSIVPQQALALSNSRIVLENASQIAKRLSDRSLGYSSESFVRLAFATILGLEPKEEELIACLEALAKWNSPLDTPSRLDSKEPPETTTLGERENAARSELVWVLLNHHHFVSLP